MLSPTTYKVACCLILTAGGFLNAQTPISPPAEPNPISENWRWQEYEVLRGLWIQAGTEDSEKNIWLAHSEYLYRYDGVSVESFSYSFDVFAIDEDYETNEEIISLDRITDLVATKDGSILLGCGRGIFKFKEGTWEKLLSIDILEYPGNLMVRGPDESVIIAAPDGLYSYRNRAFMKHLDSDKGFSNLHFRNSTLWMRDVESGNVLSCKWQKDRPESQQAWNTYYVPEDPDGRWDMCIDREGVVWIVPNSPRLRIHKIDPSTGQLSSRETNFKTGFARNTPPLLELDSKGVPMIRTLNAIIIQDDKHWKTLRRPDFPVGRLHGFHFYRKNGNLVFGNRRSSIYEIHLGKDTWKTYKDVIFQCETKDQTNWYLRSDGRVLTQDLQKDTWKIYPPSIDTPTALVKSSDETIWVTGSHGGDAAVARLVDGEWLIDTHPRLGPRICYNSAYADTDGSILFGSGIIPGELPSQLGGVVGYKLGHSGHALDPKYGDIEVQRVYGIDKAPDNSLLFGEFSITRVREVNGSFRTRRDRSLTELWIDNLLVDSLGNTWVALWGIGIRKYVDGRYHEFNHNSSLGTNQVVYLMEDKLRPGRVWVATDHGLSWFENGVWSEISLPPVLNMERESGSLRQSSDGKLWINHFHREWYDRDSPVVVDKEVVYEGFRTYQFVPETTPPVATITDYEEMVSEDGDTFIRWTGVDPWGETPTDKLKYSHRIDDGQWTKFSSEANAVLVDLDSGKHTFSLRAQDAAGNIQQVPTTLAFAVRPPIWLRAWFIIVASAGLLSIAGLITLIVMLRIRHIQELEEAKINFFTNVSHELRNPLTVIEGPVESLLKKTTDIESKEYLKLIQKSTRKTIRILNQLLEFRKSDSGTWHGHIVHGEFIEFVRESISIHQQSAYSKNQTIHFNSAQDTLYTEFDEEKIQTVIDNLLSNAIKYTQENGRIQLDIKLNEESRTLSFSVTDNGYGIPQEDQNKVFDPFYQTTVTSKLKHVKGTGLGLPLINELVHSMDGTIKVESPVQIDGATHNGTRFTVKLPLKDYTLLPQVQKLNGHSGVMQQTILVVEDNKDVRNFLAKELQNTYNIITASNGREAWEKMASDPPDLVLSDVMMPEMDGMELCSRIKSTESTSHVPIIMLSALDDDETKLKGFESKADDYVSKPIKIDLLKLKLSNYFKNQKAMVEKFKREILNPENGETNLESFKPSNHFLEKVVEAIMIKIDDPAFDVEALAEMMHMSRTTLYRKIKSLTGDSSITFIQKIRIKQASDLLLTGNYTVSQVAEKVGIKELSYFSTLFKKYHKCTPTEFIKSNV
ncbi:MAG: ATP-binding protein [Puniceicoccaceae bacterium]